MKKWIVTLLALMLSVMMLLSMTACESKDNTGDTDTTPSNSASDDEKEEADEEEKEEAKDPAEMIIGTWEADLNFSELMEYSVKLDESAPEVDFDLPDVKLRFTFGEDESAAMTIDEESLYAMWKDYVEEVTEIEIERQGLEMTVDEYCEMNNTTLEDMTNAMMDIGDAFTKDFEGNGTYKLDGEKLHIIEEDEEFDEESYMTVAFESGNFVIKKPADVEYDENGRNEAVEIMFPIIFRRIA